MKTASISVAKNRLSAYLDLVRAGETVTITDRGTPVARLVPFTCVDASDRRRELERHGVIVAGAGGRALDALLESEPPKPAAAVDVVALLAAERAEGERCARGPTP